MINKQYEIEMYNNLDYHGVECKVLAIEIPAYTLCNGKSEVTYNTIYTLNDDYGDHMTFTYQTKGKDSEDARRTVIKAYYKWIYGEYKEYEDEKDDGTPYTVTIEMLEAAEDWSEKEIYNTIDLTPIEW